MTEKIDDEVSRATVAGMLNPGLVFELIENRFDNGPFAEQQFIGPGKKPGLYVAFEGRD